MRVRLRMRHVRLAVALWAVWQGSALAAEVGGGGLKVSDCLTTFVAAVNVPPANPRHVTCKDGDSACDTDNAVNGICRVQVSVCANSTFSTSCTLNGVSTIVVDHALDNGADPKFDPDFLTLQSRIDSQINLTEDPGMQPADQCTTPSTVSVAIKGPFGTTCAARTRVVRLRTTSGSISGKVYKDIDTLNIKCVPNIDMMGCDAQTLWPTGTFERIQKQIFDQSCAVATCHDSESQRGSLLLESGASLNNLINVNPITGGAISAGWKRVDAADVGVSGNPDTSFLYHKIKGGLPNSSYGARMPFKRPKLNKALIEVVRLWILAGAPDTGWVAGTF